MYEVIDEFSVNQDEVLLTITPKPAKLAPGDKLQTGNGTFEFLHLPLGVKDETNQITVAAKKLN